MRRFTLTAAAVVAAGVAAAVSWDAAAPLDLNKLYQEAAACGTVVVPAGEHPVQRIDRDPSKDGWSCRIVFKGEPGAKLAGFSTGRSGGSGNTQGAAHFELDSLEVGGQLKLTLADDVVLRNISGGSFSISSSTNVQVLGGEFGPWVDGVNHINRCGTNPVCPPPTDIVLDGVDLHDFLISNPAPHSECLMIWGPGTERVTIRNSTFRNCTDFGLLVKAPGASGIVIGPGNRFDAPMPGDRATSECNPDCPRGGSSIRFSGPSERYEGSSVTGNVIAGKVSVDCGCVPVVGNTAEPPATEPPAGFRLRVLGETATTITFGWEPTGGAGYRFSKAGQNVSHTWDGARSSVRFGKPGPYRVEALAVTDEAEG